jgi:hypothetical protein
MRLPALIHLLGAVQSLARPERICLLGSSALLASFPDLGEKGGPLELSFDADLLIEPCDEQLAAMLHEAVGEGSLFARRTGYHADILRPEISRTLPHGWESRLVKMGETKTEALAALSPEDLVVVKLRAGRSKDLELCRTLIHRRLLTASAVRQRLDETPLPEHEIRPVYERLREICL